MPDWEAWAKFGEMVRTRRLAKKLGLRAVARAVGISATYLSQCERGRATPPAEPIVQRLAEALDLNPDELCLAAHRLPADIRALLMQHGATIFPVLRRHFAGKETPE